MNLYTLPLNVLIQIFTCSTQRDRNKHLSFVCHKFWMIRKKHFVNVAFLSELHRKWKRERLHLRPQKLLLLVNIKKSASLRSTTISKCFVKNIGKFCKKFARKKVTILVQTPYLRHYNHYYKDNDEEVIRDKIENLICELENKFNTPGADCCYVRKFTRINGCFNHEFCNMSWYEGVTFNTSNL